MNPPNTTKQTNYDNNTIIAIVVGIVSSSIFSHEMHGQPLWLRVIVAAATGGVVAGLVMWSIKRFRRN